MAVLTGQIISCIFMQGDAFEKRQQ